MALDGVETGKSTAHEQLRATMMGTVIPKGADKLTAKGTKIEAAAVLPHHIGN